MHSSTKDFDLRDQEEHFVPPSVSWKLFCVLNCSAIFTVAIPLYYLCFRSENFWLSVQAHVLIYSLLTTLWVGLLAQTYVQSYLHYTHQFFEWRRCKLLQLTSTSSTSLHHHHLKPLQSDQIAHVYQKTVPLETLTFKMFQLNSYLYALFVASSVLLDSLDASSSGIAVFGPMYQVLQYVLSVGGPILLMFGMQQIATNRAHVSSSSGPTSDSTLSI